MKPNVKVFEKADLMKIKKKKLTEWKEKEKIACQIPKALGLNCKFSILGILKHDFNSTIYDFLIFYMIIFTENCQKWRRCLNFYGEPTLF